MRARLTVAAVAVGVLLAGCGSGGSDAAPAQETPAAAADNRVDVTSGRPLAEFKGSESYDFRVALYENRATALADIQKIARHLEEKDLRDVLDTCSDIAKSLPEAKRIANAVTRFSGGAGEEVTDAQAKQLIAASQRIACPA